MSQHPDFRNNDFFKGWLDSLNVGEQDIGCGQCYACLKDVRTSGTNLPITMQMMIVCSDCGNKRCPKSTDHTLECTGSNEPGQVGSRYA